MTASDGTSDYVTQYTYDPKGNLTHEELPDGSTRDWAYDPTFSQVTYAKVTDVDLGIIQETAYYLDASNGNVVLEDEIGHVKDAGLGSTIPPTISGIAVVGPSTGLTDGILDPHDVARYYSYTSSASPNAPLLGLPETVTLKNNDAAGSPLSDQVTRYIYNTTYTFNGTSKHNTHSLVGKIIHPDTTVTYDDYDPDTDDLVQTSNERGATTQYVYDQIHELIQETDPDPTTGAPSGAITTYGYFGGQLVEKVSPDPSGSGGFPVDYEYNSLGELLSSTTERLDYVGPPNGYTRVTTTNTYTLTGSLATSTDPNGDTTTYEYDDLDRLWKVTKPDPDGAAPALHSTVTEYAYDGLNRVSVVLDVTDANSPMTMGAYSYGKFGRSKYASEMGGPTHETDYDTLGRVMTAQDPTSVYDALRPVLSSVSYDYDKLGRPAQYSGFHDAKGDLLPTLGPTFDSAGNMLTQTDASGDTTQYSYDPLNNRLLSKILPPDPSTPSTPGPTYTYTYDDAGNLKSVTDPSYKVTSYIYDFLNRLTSVTAPSVGTAARAVTAYAYDNLGRVVTVTGPDPDGSGPQLPAVTNYGYDSLGLVTAVTDSSGTTRYGYDANGNNTSLTDPLGNTSTWTYDALDRVTAETDPLGHSQLYAYDDQGDMVQKTDRDGRVTQYTYDMMHQLTEEDWISGGQTVRTMRYSYNPGALASAEDVIPASGQQQADTILSNYSFDGYGDANGPGRIMVTMAGLTPIVELDQQFNYDHNRTSFSAIFDGTPDFQNVYGYDALGRLSTITQSGVAGANAVAEKSVSFTYNANSLLGSITRYDDLAQTALVAQTDYTYDAASQLTGILDRTGSDVNNLDTTLASYSYTYDTAGRITSLTTNIDGTATYSYDTSGQLTNASGGGVSASYAYDANGNRTGYTLQTGTDRVLDDSTFTYTYDPEGNCTSRTRISTAPANDHTTEYTWDYRNRLTEVTTNDASGNVTGSTSYLYDPLDRRIGTDVANAQGVVVHRERYIYDGDNVVLSFEADTSGDLQTTDLAHRYLFGPAVDQVLADEDLVPLSGGGGNDLSQPGTVNWLLADAEGTIRDVVHRDSESGVVSVVDHLAYDAFGNIVSQTDPSQEPRFTYAGRERDKTSGLHYVRARWYDPGTGRFISEDPMSFAAGDANLYRYVGNSPTNRIDPSGLQGIDPYVKRNNLISLTNEFSREMGNGPTYGKYNTLAGAPVLGAPVLGVRDPDGDGDERPPVSDKRDEHVESGRAGGGGGDWLDAYAHGFNNLLGSLGSWWSDHVGNLIHGGLVGTGLVSDQTLANASANQCLLATTAFAAPVGVGLFAGGEALLGIGTVGSWMAGGAAEGGLVACELQGAAQYGTFLGNAAEFAELQTQIAGLQSEAAGLVEALSSELASEDAFAQMMAEQQLLQNLETQQFLQAMENITLQDMYPLWSLN